MSLRNELIAFLPLFHIRDRLSCGLLGGSTRSRRQVSYGACIALLVISTFISACVTGPSSGKVKQAITKSWIFQSAPIFYPSGHADDQYPTLSPAEIHQIELGLKRHLKLLLHIQEVTASLIRKRMDVSLPSHLDAEVYLLNNGSAKATSIQLNNRLEISIDVRVLQALFKGSLASSLHDELSDKGQNSKQATVVKTDAQLINEFFVFRQEVLSADAGNFYGDAIHAIRDDSQGDRFETMIDFAETAQEMDNRYSGALLFILAHELGHSILGHHAHSCDAPLCAIFQADELRADEFAGYLLGAYLAPLGIFGEDPAFWFTHLSGYGIFLEDAFSRAGFASPDESFCKCSYPATTTRSHIAGAGRRNATADWQSLSDTDHRSAEQITKALWKARKISQSGSKN